MPTVSVMQSVFAPAEKFPDSAVYKKRQLLDMVSLRNKLVIDSF